jgi:hypothetical protein
MPGPRNRTGTDPSLNHPLTMPYMGAGSGREKGWGAGIFTLPCEREGRGAEGRGVGLGWSRRSAQQRVVANAVRKIGLLRLQRVQRPRRKGGRQTVIA